MTKKLSIADCERIGSESIDYLGFMYDGHSFFEEVKKQMLAERQIATSPYERDLAPGADALKRLLAQHAEEGSGAKLDRLHLIRIQELHNEWTKI